MADQNKQKRYFFLGIGGIGMSALARFYNAKGAEVAGYDRTRSELCKQLESEGIAIHYEDNVDMILAQFKKFDETLIVFTPAIPAENAEFRYFKDNGFTMLKRAQLLGNITREHKGLCVAGTHGKTTTCNMIANILQQTSKGCNAFLGGISLNFGTNLLLSDKTDRVVIEADEYDRSFLNLEPQIAVITSADADHLDIYGDVKRVRESFAKFTSLIKEGGALLLKRTVKVKPQVKKGVKVYSYSGRPAMGGKRPDFYATFIRKMNGTIRFNMVTPYGVIKDIDLGVPILINVEDAVAAIAVALLCGARHEEIRLGMSTFRGTKRRFETHYHNVKDGRETRYIDDYAHHPAEIKATLDSVRFLYPDLKICAVFQPHLYTRTRDLAADFAEALSIVDDVVLLDIYPAREKPIPGVTSSIILEKVTSKKKVAVSKTELIGELEKHDFDILLTLGAGDIDLEIPKIVEFMHKRND